MKRVIITVFFVFVAVATTGCGNGNVWEDATSHIHWIDVGGEAHAEFRKNIGMWPLQVLWTSFEEKSAQIETEIDKISAEYDVVWLRLQYSENGYLIDATVGYAEKGTIGGGIHLEVIRGESRQEILKRIDEAEKNLGGILKIKKIDNGEKLATVLIFYKGEEV
jgi:hypothetical protein